jgi:hypothetical protein
MRRIASTVTALLALALIVPGVGHAEVLAPECMFDPIVSADPLTFRALAVGDSCTTTFEITAAEANHHVSLLGTHGGLHGYPTNGGFGHVSLQWKDNGGAVVAEYSCLALANNADYTPTDLSHASCETVVAPPATLPIGESTLTATVTQLYNSPAGGTRLHGRIVLRDDLI